MLYIIVNFEILYRIGGPMRGAGYVRVSEQYKTVHNFFILQVYVKKKI